MESQDEPLFQSGVQLSVNNFWKFAIQVQNFLSRNLENILFWSVAVIIAMLYCLLFAMLIYYQRRYLILCM